VSRFQCFRTDQRQIRWRLLGGNNRVLGISAHTLPDHATALDEVNAVRKCAETADYDLTVLPRGLWGWRMRIGGVEIAHSVHGFARRVDANLASERFRQRAPTADTDLTLAVFQPGRRGREITFHDEPS